MSSVLVCCLIPKTAVQFQPDPQGSPSKSRHPTYYPHTSPSSRPAFPPLDPAAQERSPGTYPPPSDQRRRLLFFSTSVTDLLSQPHNVTGSRTKNHISCPDLCMHFTAVYAYPATYAKFPVFPICRYSPPFYGNFPCSLLFRISFLVGLVCGSDFSLSELCLFLCLHFRCSFILASKIHSGRTLCKSFSHVFCTCTSTYPGASPFPGWFKRTTGKLVLSFFSPICWSDPSNPVSSMNHNTRYREAIHLG